MLRRKPILSLAGLLVLALLIAGCFDVSSGVVPGRPADVTKTPDFPGDGARDADLASHVPGELIVGVESEALAHEVAASLNAELAGYLEPIGAALLVLEDPDASLTDAMRSLQGVDGVRYAQANFTEYTLPYIQEEPQLETGFRSVAGRRVTVGLMEDDEEPGEEEEPKTWYERFQYGPRITRAVEAWERGLTGNGRLIAVIDTGVDGTHPDLAGKVLLGYNPDYHREGLDPHDTADFHGHGTHVAATAAGHMNVAAGERMTVGMAPDANIFPLRVFNPQGGGYTSTSYGIAMAIMVAADPSIAGFPYPPADVANMSLGGPVYSQAMQDAIHFAAEQGTIVVASMGNSYNQEVDYPAAYQQVLAVAATNARDEVTDFSTTGPHTSVGAPGEFVFAATPGGWSWMSGTSMAAPHVSGAVALLRQDNPSLTVGAIKDLLERTADSKNGFTRSMGHGRINVLRALDDDGEGTDYGVLEVYVLHGSEPANNANVVLFKGGRQVDTVRTGGAWVMSEGVMYDGLAFFYELEPGDDYSIAVSLDPVLHGEHDLKPMERITVDANRATRVNVFFP